MINKKKKLKDPLKNKSKHKKALKYLKRVIIILICLGFLGLFITIGINIYVVQRYKGRILTEEEFANMQVDCILVLGAGVWNERPSLMLRDRLERAVDLYRAGSSERILMTGDNGRVDYDEVNVMKQFAVNLGIDRDVVFMDHAGFSTYESMYRAKEIFGVESVIIVTQEYHLYRSLYIANQLGLEAYGVSAAPNVYYGQLNRDIREVAARVKDFFYVILQPKPTYLGEVIPISGSGSLTDDRID